MHTREGFRLSPADSEPAWARRSSRSLRRTILSIGVIGISASSLIAWQNFRVASQARRSATTQQVVEVDQSLRSSLQHERELAAAARSLFAADPTTTSADLSRWTARIDLDGRYPEVRGIAVAGYVTDRSLAALAPEPSAPPSAPVAVDCLVQAATGPADRGSSWPAGVDLCGDDLRTALLAARVSGEPSSLSPTEALGRAELILQVPLYRDGLIPATLAARQATFLGAIAVVIDPKLLLAQALVGSPNLALALTYSDGSSQLTVPSQGASEDALNASRDLGDGWSLASADHVASGPLTDPQSRNLLFAGVVLTALCALVVHALWRSRARAQRDVTHRGQDSDRQSLHDGLTGLSNKATVLERVEQLLTRSRRNKTVVAALFIDLDGFKSVNDTFGHRVGDELLRAAARRLLTVFRLADTVGRMDGDQFVVLMEGDQSSGWTERAAQRVLDIMRHPFAIDISGTPRPFFITASVGLAIGDRPTGSELLRDADLAMCRAKDDGSDCFELFQASMHQTMRHRLALEVDIHAALDNDEFELHYQPIYDVNDLTVVGVEALLRWNHPRLGLIQPDDFIAALERTGQIIEVGRWVLNQACRQAAQWQLAGRPIAMSVNVSARQLDRHAFAAEVHDALFDNNLAPGVLTIEITESALMRDPTRTAQLLGTIKALGTRVAIDDFGTGFSSLACIQQFPIDSLKIDRSFTQAIGTSPESDALLRTMVQLAADLGLQTVAEGVESLDQLDGLREAQVNFAQGYLLARPLDARTMTNNILQASSGPSGPRRHPVNDA